MPGRYPSLGNKVQALELVQDVVQEEPEELVQEQEQDEVLEAQVEQDLELAVQAVDPLHPFP